MQYIFITVLIILFSEMMYEIEVRTVKASPFNLKEFFAKKLSCSLTNNMKVRKSFFMISSNKEPMKSFDVQV